MHSGKIIFSQIMDFLPMYEFRKCINRYQGNYKIKSFSCFDQFLCMAFAQLTYRESLRDIEACLRSMQNKLYHMGIHWQGFKKYSCPCKRKTELAYLCRLRLSTNPHRQKLIYQRWLWSRTGQYGLCPRFYNHRSMSFSIPLGTLSSTKRCCKNAYTHGFTGKYHFVEDAPLL